MLVFSMLFFWLKSVPLFENPILFSKTGIHKQTHFETNDENTHHNTHI